MAIRLGMIGSGFMGRTYSECLAKYTANGQLAAVAGGSRAPELAKDYGVDHIEDVEGLMARKDIDGVIVTSPEMFHREQTLMAASAGKHVLVEKPMAPDLGQCQAMIEGCRTAGVNLMVVQSQRFRSVHRQAHQLVREGRIGRLQQIRFWAHQNLSHTVKEVVAKPFYMDPEGGGLYMGYAVHCFDMVRWIAGAEALSVYASVQSFGDHPVPDAHTMALVRFAGGAVAQLWISLEMPVVGFPGSRFHTQVVGSKGLLDFDGYSHLDVADETGWQRVAEQAPLDLRNPADPVRLRAYADLVQDFIDSVADGLAPSVTGEDGRRAVELCLAARQSARTGQPVALQSDAAE